MSDFGKLIQKEGLPRVGQTVCIKDYNTLWRVMKKKKCAKHP